MGKQKKKLFVIGAILLLVIILGLIFGLRFFKGNQTKTDITTAVADRGVVEVIISGTGTIEPNASYEVTSLVKGEIMSAPFEEGTIVNKGDLLYQIDTADVENSIEKSKLSLERTQNTYLQNQRDINNLNVRSQVNGNITALYVKKGDNVSANSKIAEVINSNQMKLTIPFISEHAQMISLGETAEVILQSDNNVVWGTVTRITTGELVSASGIIVKNVEILVENPGNIREGDTATAMVGDVSCNDVGTFAYLDAVTVIAEVSGKVEQIYAMEGDYVCAGDVIVKLSSESLLQSQKSSALSLKEAELSLENQYEQFDNYNITSPINGTVIQKNSKEGDTLDNTNSTKVMATIADLSKILFQMSVDELDISKIKVGQTVSVTADALEGKVFDGYVETVSIIGTSSNGVTSYPVTIVVNEPEGLIPGMNVSANIVVERKENVVRIPASALKRGNRVAVQLKPGEKMQEPATDAPKGPGSMMMRDAAPEGFKMVAVKPGLSNDNFIEILEGISEGDVVQTTAMTVSTTMTQGMGGMPGGMGGMPAGGMSGGRMPGGMSGGAMPR